MGGKTGKKRAAGGKGSPKLTSEDIGPTPVAAAAHPRKVAHLTPAERTARGKAARNEVPRSSHGGWAPAQDRPDPVALLEEQGKSRVPELVPIRYGRMLVSPFTFFRGAALIMASDLAATAALRPQRAALRRRPPVQLRGVRLARAAADVRHQRLRRDPPRPVGVGREAARAPASRSPAGTAASPPTERREVVLAAVAEYRRGMRQARRRWATSTSGTPTSRSTQLFEQLKAERQPASSAAQGRGRPWPRPGPGTACRRSPS